MLKKLLLLIVILTGAGIPSEAQQQRTSRVAQMKKIGVLSGNWNLETKMIPVEGQPSTESGTMNCRFALDSTYMECDVQLKNARWSRQYKQMITYRPDSARYEILYLYSDSPIHILENGWLTGNELKSTTSFINGQGRREEIRATMRINDNDNLWYEGASSETNWKIDYEAKFVRVK